jgi:hypothetical protein
MQRSILVKPNLKLILLGALLIAVLHDVFTSGRSQASSFREHHYRVSWVSDAELVRLVDEVDAVPNSAGYMLISEACEKRGEMRKAMYYLKKANIIGKLEDPEE